MEGAPVAVAVLTALAEDGPIGLHDHGLSGYPPAQIEAALKELARIGCIDERQRLTDAGRSWLEGLRK